MFKLLIDKENAWKYYRIYRIPINGVDIDQVIDGKSAEHDGAADTFDKADITTERENKI